MKNTLSGYIENNIHYLPLRVYYSDTDAGSVVYHSRYLDMAEHGRTEFLRCLGGHQRELFGSAGLAFVVRSLKIEYIKPGKLDDLITVHTAVMRCDRLIIRFRQEIFREGDLLAALEVKVGSISLETGRPLPMPDEIREEIRKFLI